MNAQVKISSVVPFSLKDAPAFIERQMPVGRISAESYKERTAGSGQTLTALGSYWKGRKPLIMVRATVLGCLLPATADPLGDLRIFLVLMGMDDSSFRQRIKAVRAQDIDTLWPKYHLLIQGGEPVRWKEELPRAKRLDLIGEWLATLPYDDRLDFCFRSEEVDEAILLEGIWPDVNARLKTCAKSFQEVIEQLGIMRYGHRPVLADTFCGGGSIPFEAARMGCEVYASDLNPIACMLTWGAFNIIGASEAKRMEFERAQNEVVASVNAEITALGIEHDADGNRAKAFLYCLETRCPKTGWIVPMAPSWVISRKRGVIAKLVPDHDAKRYEIEIVQAASAREMADAAGGTVRDGRLLHPMNPDRNGVSIGVIRGDHRDSGSNGNRLRKWDRSDFLPRLDDIWQERLYCVQWMTKESLSEGRQSVFFKAVTPGDALREQRVEAIVAGNLTNWQDRGLVPDMEIEAGDKTDEPIRTRGWTHWHHLFNARQLHYFAMLGMRQNNSLHAIEMSRLLDRSTKLNRWSNSSGGGGQPTNIFDNQAFNTQYNYAMYASFNMGKLFLKHDNKCIFAARTQVKCHSAKQAQQTSDIFITDPPYADAVSYHEITEFFIAWLRKNPPPPFEHWTWDSQRSAAIKGSDEKFRSDMVAAYSAMGAHMPDNGMQVAMFTHQDAGVWADLAAIMWAAGLRVTAAWNIVTEAASGLKDGNYVQGTILLVLRKRVGGGNAKRMDIEEEIEKEVDHQLASLGDLAQDWTSERLYTDCDMQLAAYAAALRVITNYETIDRVKVGADVYRKVAKGERTVIRSLIEYAASVANNKLVPDGFAATIWRDLDKHSRFYVRMLDMEAKGATKTADYQDFAKSFSIPDHTALMASTKANEASLAGSFDLKAKWLGGEGFGSTPLRNVLFAVYKTMQKDDPADGVSYLRTGAGLDYWAVRTRLIELAKYVAMKTARTRPMESSAADLLAQKLEVDRL